MNGTGDDTTYHDILAKWALEAIVLYLYITPLKMGCASENTSTSGPLIHHRDLCTVVVWI